MTQKIIYFTAGEKATTEELAEIAALNTKAAVPYEVVVRRADKQLGDDYGDDRLEACDFVAGTVPTAYNSETVFDIDAMPAEVDEGDTIGLTDSANTTVNATAAIDNLGVLTAALPSTAKILKSTVQVPCPAPSGTRTTGYVFTIVNGAITAAVGY